MTMRDYGEIHNMLLAGIMTECRKDPDKNCVILGPVVVKDMEKQGGRIDVLRYVLNLYGITLFMRDDCPSKTVYLTNRERFERDGYKRQDEGDGATGPHGGGDEPGGEDPSGPGQ